VFGDKPLIVVTAAQSPQMATFSAEQAAALAEDHRVLQARMLSLSRNSEQQLVDCSHYVRLERPDVVIAAIRDVVIAVRHGSKLAVHVVIPSSLHVDDQAVGVRRHTATGNRPIDRKKEHVSPRLQLQRHELERSRLRAE